MNRWLYGTIVLWALKKHIRKEIRPTTISMGSTRADAKLVCLKRFSKLFDEAWPS